ncbi:MAG TPA: hypothetical protein VM553_19020, partial [Dongiaceae bacterium]|nr:hypothetical protein [Dongiaceae bacterium]
IYASPARVEMNLSGNIHIFNSTQAEGDRSARYWHVFDLIADNAGNVTVQPVERFVTDIDELTPAATAQAYSLKKPEAGELTTKKYAPH